MVTVKKPLISVVDGWPIRPSGVWIDKKHFYLRRYMEIFTKGMGKKWSMTYIDLFAGPGRCVIESSGAEKDGSPLISLEYGFSKYIFIEKNHNDLEALKKRSQHSPKHSSIEFIPGDCNEVIGKVHPSDLSLAFIDPTGIDVHFETVKTLTANRRVDILMNIQLGMDIKRNFVRYKKEGDSSDLGLFLGGDVPWEKIHTAREAVNFYKQRIRGLGYSTVEFKDITVRTHKTNVPMYFLFFASKNPRGLDFWKKITKKDESGQMEMF